MPNHALRRLTARSLLRNAVEVRVGAEENLAVGNEALTPVAFHAIQGIEASCGGGSTTSIFECLA